jgi:hypothetical protein
MCRQRPLLPLCSTTALACFDVSIQPTENGESLSEKLCPLFSSENRMLAKLKIAPDEGGHDRDDFEIKKSHTGHCRSWTTALELLSARLLSAQELFKDITQDLCEQYGGKKTSTKVHEMDQELGYRRLWWVELIAHSNSDFGVEGITPTIRESSFGLTCKAKILIH